MHLLRARLLQPSPSPPSQTRRLAGCNMSQLAQTSQQQKQQPSNHHQNYNNSVLDSEGIQKILRLLHSWSVVSGLNTFKVTKQSTLL